MIGVILETVTTAVGTIANVAEFFSSDLHLWEALRTIIMRFVSAVDDSRHLDIL